LVGAGIGAGSDAVVCAVLVCDDGLLQAVSNVLARMLTAAIARICREP